MYAATFKPFSNYETQSNSQNVQGYVILFCFGQHL